MQRRHFLASLAATSAACAQSTQSAPSRSRLVPNVLLIIYDKCRADALGCYGFAGARTPNLDRLAASGVRFDHAYTPQSLCAPARASMLTGLYPHAHGVIRNVYPGRASISNSNFPDPVIDPFRDPRFRLWDNMVFHLSNAGYATGCVGKWHLGPANPGFFDTFKAFNSLLRHWVGEPHRSAYRPDVETDEGIRFIEANADRPWFLYQSYYAPHEPLDPPKEWAAKFAGKPNADYHATIANLDWNTGRTLDALRRRNLLDKTLVIFVSDHGRSEVKRPGSSEQGIALPYEEVARVPLIMRYPARLGEAKVWHSGITTAALAPTILDVAGISLTRGLPGHDETPRLHAGSLFRTLSGSDTWTDPVIVENVPQAQIDGAYYQERVVRTARHKLILRKFESGATFRAGELYDLQADPGESVNLYAKDGKLMVELAQGLEHWARDTDDEIGSQLARHAQASQ